MTLSLCLERLIVSLSNTDFNKNLLMQNKFPLGENVVDIKKDQKALC